ncbi:MAG: subclass B3 metallo-beta-lactamase [Phenylobacterium sp.]|uniref:subclass B3 metallo-beta-lactamase n=1 Tax=Phenylobacterium sp. TaxID=1871053 RepID=UPI001A4B184D|nr:subclass B3 metallo-beta-lactamase [Phenylobacterium sp.]MBL8773110.1 subclass B3 metallo-beta-lactamase [Phenylobacterium sp.]
MSRRGSWISGAVALAAAVFVSPAAAQNAATWANPIKPFKIGEGLYYVGAYDLTAFLFVSKDGLIVLDGGDRAVGRQVVANIRALGFDPAQVKILLNTHQHFDHAAGLAEIRKAAPGAKLHASAADGPIIAAGGAGDPFLKGKAYEYEPVPVARTLRDGDKVTLGGWTLTAHVTGGHTAGCTTWTFPVKVAGKVRQALVHCSSSVLPGYRLGRTETYPGITAAYEKSFATWKSLPCEVFLASHGAFFDMNAKRARLDAGDAAAFVDPAGCRAFYARQEAAFRAELSKQNP